MVMDEREVTKVEDRRLARIARHSYSKYGKLALVAPPAITMMLSTSMASPAIASSTGGNPQKGNNGVGNGPDPQPPGNPKVNDDGGQPRAIPEQ